jgi:hypothetical protein
VGPFSDDWVNMVGLTGVVLKGPFLQHFGSTGKVKASLVLGLFARTTGEAVADAPRAILVSAADLCSLIGIRSMCTWDHSLPLGTYLMYPFPLSTCQQHVLLQLHLVSFAEVSAYICHFLGPHCRWRLGVMTPSC